MKLTKLTLKNFRNFNTFEKSFEKDVNILIGLNGQGKTSLVESIFMLSTTKSHRVAKDSHVIKLGEEFSVIKGSFMNSDDEIDLSVHLVTNKKIAKINGVQVQKLADFVGNLKAVFFAPEDLFIIKGNPSNRRKFIDIGIAQIDNNYVYHLMTYKKILKQRNEILKKYNEYESSDLMLDVFNNQLVPHVLYITQKRCWYLKELNRLASKNHAYLSDTNDIVVLEYNSFMNGVEITEEQILKMYEDGKKRDIVNKSTQIGPHRDDFNVLLSNYKAQIFASQGQQRTLILAIKLSEIDLIKQVTGITPILLLDDVLSELDNNRQVRLLKRTIGNSQTFITTTSLNGITDKIIEEAEIFEIKNSKIGD